MVEMLESGWTASARDVPFQRRLRPCFGPQRCDLPHSNINKSGVSKRNMHKTERNLVRQFVRGLRDVSCPWGKVGVSSEFDYSRGRADLVVAAEDGNHLIAFEAKLQKWRDALQQAYRNLCFADSSYVILPRRTAMRAQLYAGSSRIVTLDCVIWSVTESMSF
jgi:hypothetical protein